MDTWKILFLSVHVTITFGGTIPAMGFQFCMLDFVAILGLVLETCNKHAEILDIAVHIVSFSMQI